jgi:CRISPR-associated protein Cas2
VRCLVVYDISDDKLRAKVADICQDFGLDRIQYSAFAGRLARTHVEELGLKIKRRLGRAKDAKVQIFSICEKDWDERIDLP